MRQPTDLSHAFGYWRDALAMRDPAIDMNDPRPGFYRSRCKGGPWVGVAIWIEQDVDTETGELVADEKIVCTVNGEIKDALEEWTWCADKPIPESEYRYLIASAKYAREHAPDLPLANPRRPIDLMTAPVPF